MILVFTISNARWRGGSNLGGSPPLTVFASIQRWRFPSKKLLPVVSRANIAATDVARLSYR